MHAQPRPTYAVRRDRRSRAERRCKPRRRRPTPRCTRRGAQPRSRSAGRPAGEREAVGPAEPEHGTGGARPALGSSSQAASASPRIMRSAMSRGSRARAPRPLASAGAAVAVPAGSSSGPPPPNLGRDPDQLCTGRRPDPQPPPEIGGAGSVPALRLRRNLGATRRPGHHRDDEQPRDRCRGRAAGAERRPRRWRSS